VAARCPHFGECGGCAAQDVPYADQLARKATALRDLFAPWWDGPIPVTPSPELWHYRNKVDPAFGRKHYPEPPPKGFKRETVLGFKRKGRWYWTLDIDECAIAPEGLGRLLGGVRQWARERDLPAFSTRSHDGFLRVLLVREGRRTDERVVVLITTDGPLDDASFVETVLQSFPATSIQHAVFRGLADVAAADEVRTLYGPDAIHERLLVPDDEGPRDITFRFSPFSFFQTNTLATERLYGIVRQWVKRLAPDVLYDLYGGSGGIALTCADLVQRVISVESVESATLDGQANARLNRVDNVAFETAKVEDWLRDARAGNGLSPNAAVVLDPPRAGLHPKALRRLNDLAPTNVLYISCKPPRLAEELNDLAATYTLTGLQAVDLFPHTDHVEAVAALRRRDATE